MKLRFYVKGLISASLIGLIVSLNTLIKPQVQDVVRLQVLKVEFTYIFTRIRDKLAHPCT